MCAIATLSTSNFTLAGLGWNLGICFCSSANNVSPICGPLEERSAKRGSGLIRIAMLHPKDHFLSCFAVTVLLCESVRWQIWTEKTRAVRKVSSHSEYLENVSRGLDVNWQPEETLLCIREQSLSRGASQSAVRRR